MNNLQPIHRGINVILSVNDKIIGGQNSATLNRTMSPIKITNQINGEWENSLSGVKSWTLVCTGLVVKSEEAFQELEVCFNTGTAVTVKLADADKTYTGSALITDFPVSAPYNTNFSYSISLLGINELTIEQE